MALAQRANCGGLLADVSQRHNVVHRRHGRCVPPVAITVTTVIPSATKASIFITFCHYWHRCQWHRRTNHHRHHHCSRRCIDHWHHYHRRPCCHQDCHCHHCRRCHCTSSLVLVGPLAEQVVGDCVWGWLGGGLVNVQCKDDVASAKKHACPTQLRSIYLATSLGSHSASADVACTMRKPKW